MRHSQAITPSIHKVSPPLISQKRQEKDTNQNQAQFLPTSGYGRTFLLITLLESGIDIVLEAIVIARLKLIPSLKLPSNPGDFSPARSPLAVYLAIFIAAHLFQLYFAVDALRHKNTIQLIGLCCFNFAFLVYAIIQVCLKPSLSILHIFITQLNSLTQLTQLTFGLVRYPKSEKSRPFRPPLIPPLPPPSSYSSSPFALASHRLPSCI
jgi:hypothetical protein